jgi:competence protein ComEC
MAAGLHPASDPAVGAPQGSFGSPGSDSIWRAPLVPFGLAGTAGIVLDRYADIPLLACLICALAGIVAWTIFFLGGKPQRGVVYLVISVTALGAGYHHGYRNVYAADDIGEFVTADARPAQLRGLLEEEPTIQWQPPQSLLQSIPRPDSGPIDPTVAVIRVAQLRREDDWQIVSGRVQLVVAGHLKDLHAGDEVEAVGRLAAPPGPANPGEMDYASHLLDRRIRAQLIVVKTPNAVTRLSRSWPWSWRGWLMVIRGWAQRTLDQALPEQSGLATALLLGTSSSMTHADWDKYIHTGVVHALAISGLHIIVLAAFLWQPLRFVSIRRSRAAWFVALSLLSYALLAGGRPPVMRAAVVVCVFCGSLILRRRVLPANSFALAWLIVALLNPTDLFTPGCQISFLSVAVLHWGARRWFARKENALDRLAAESMALWQRGFHRLFGTIRRAYAVTLVVWLCVTPLVVSHCQVIPFAGLALGPPMALLTPIALIAGFLLLLTAAVCPPLQLPFAWITRWCLTLEDILVDFGDRYLGGHGYWGTLPQWWLVVFYAGLFAVLTLEPLQRRWRWVLSGGLAWLCIGLLSTILALPADELRCTFLAVGHGGCIVLETPDGRTLLYDAGALGGPNVTRRQIAPYLWHRGIRRIDEVFLSHADLDHFNGLTALLERFAVGQVTHTPTFPDKHALGVQLTLSEIDRCRIPRRVVYAGDRLDAGDVQLEVLHPPPAGPEGNENARSLVLLLRHAGHTLLLTGDLDGPGLERVLKLPPVPVDVLMAPHHGSRFPNTPELAHWAQPKVVISCEGPPHGPTRPAEPYTPIGARFLGTWPHGAITVHSHTTGIVVETFQTGHRFVIRSR